MGAGVVHRRALGSAAMAWQWRHAMLCLALAFVPLSSSRSQSLPAVHPLHHAHKRVAEGRRALLVPDDRRRPLVKTTCTSVPLALEMFGVPTICMDLEFSPCGQDVSAAVRFAQDVTPLFEANFSAATPRKCIPRSSLPADVPMPVDRACNDETTYQFCVSFPTTGDDRLIITPSSVTGKPLLEVANCPTPFGLRTVPVPLPRVHVGQQCEALVGCQKCIEKSCGWCDVGGPDKKGGCMAGDDLGPLCGGCGTNCSCSWQYGSCVIPESALLAKVHKVDKAKEGTKNASEWRGKLEDEVRAGEPVSFGPENEYLCATDALRGTQAVTSAIVMIVVCLFLTALLAAFGCYVGKEGLLERVWERLQSLRAARSEDRAELTTSADTGSYVPPI